MSEPEKKEVIYKFQGDAVSCLLQAQAQTAGVKRTWTGKGADDTHLVMAELANFQRLANLLWKGVQDLYAIKDLLQLPEAAQAQLMAIILTVKANAELEKKT